MQEMRRQACGQGIQHSRDVAAYAVGGGGMIEEWGPWVEHDGKGCPCKGQFVEVIKANGAKERFVAWSIFNNTCRNDADHRTSSWAWREKPHATKIVRYRIRKPRGVVILEALLQDLPQEVNA